MLTYNLYDFLAFAFFSLKEVSSFQFSIRIHRRVAFAEE